MFNLTYDERRMILFLCSVALIGLGLNLLVKVKPASGRAIKVKADSEVTKLDINRVSYAELLGLRRVSPGLAGKIIAYRNLHGPYEKLEDLKEIKGIGDFRYEKLKKLFYISQ